jgi:hypothetical protein
MTAAARAVLAILAGLAVATRLALHARYPGIDHPDEVFQYLEQGRRLVHGAGLIPWEYVNGMRSWLLPGFWAGIWWLAGFVGTQPEVMAWAVAGVMSLLALIPVTASFLFGWHAAGLGGALLSSALVAFCPLTLHYSLHPLADTIAGALLMAGLYRLSPGGPVPPLRHHLVQAGALLALAVALRLQLAPAVLVAILGARALSRPLILGVALALVPYGLLDWVTLGTPFQSIWLHAWVNQMEGAAAAFGTAPWQAYWEDLRAYLGWAWPFLLLAAGIGAYDRPLLFWVMIAGFAALSAVGHKEVRFLAPILPLFLTLAGIGTARGLRRVSPHLALPAVATALWVTVFATQSQAPRMQALFKREVGLVLAMRAASADPAVCGLAIHPAGNWGATPGYTGLRPGISLWLVNLGPRASTTRFNAILADQADDFADLGFTRAGCWGENFSQPIPFDTICLWRRPGGCEPGPPPSLIAPLPPTVAPLPRGVSPRGHMHR